MRSAVYTGTRNLYDEMEASAKSLLFHTRIERVYFLIEDDEFPRPLPDRIQVMNVSGQTFFTPDGPNFNSPWTYMVLIRAAFTKLLPDDVVLSIDCDAFVEDDISELWDIDMSRYYLAAVPEPRKAGKPLPYINFGVCMMNLAKLRRDGIDDKAIRFLNTQYTFANEQDALNDLCYGSVLTLPSVYNACAYTKPCANPKIVHFAGVGESFPWSRERWQEKPIVRKWKETLWEGIL